MHSPIIYLIQKRQHTNYEGVLPEDTFPDDEYLFDTIHEADWLEPNTLENKDWHRGDWQDAYNDLFDQHPYMNINHLDTHSELIITKNHIQKWFKRLVELQTQYNQLLQITLNEDALFTPDIENNHDKFIKRLEYKNMVEGEYGGVRFVIYDGFYDEDEPTRVGTMSTKELIEYVKQELTYDETQPDHITFELCHNITGDYHF